MTDWLTNGGFGFGGVVLGYLVPAFVSRKKDAGDQALELIGGLRDELQGVKEGHEECRRETAELRALSTRNDIVIRLVVPELQRVSPYSTALQQARSLLGDAFPVPVETPQEMQDALNRIDGRASQ